MDFTDPIPVTMYWDADNLPSSVDDAELVENVNVSLKRINPRFYLSKIVVCAADTQGFDTRRDLFDCTVNYIRAPMRDLTCDECTRLFRPSLNEVEHADQFSRVKEVGDRRLIERMLSEAHETRGAVPFLLVTTDRDFRYAMSNLDMDGYTILSAIEDDSDGVPLVARTAVAYWVWNDIQQGGHHVLRPVSPPRIPLRTKPRRYRPC